MMTLDQSKMFNLAAGAVLFAALCTPLALGQSTPPPDPNNCPGTSSISNEDCANTVTECVGEEVGIDSVELVGDDTCYSANEQVQVKVHLKGVCCGSEHFLGPYTITKNVASGAPGLYNAETVTVSPCGNDLTGNVPTYTIQGNAPGSVELPVTANITKAMIEDRIEGIVDPEDVKQSVDGLTSAVNAKLEEIANAEQTTIQQLLEDWDGISVADIVSDVQAELDGKGDEIATKLGNAIDTTAGTIKSGLDALAPKITISGVYKYDCDPSKSAWNTPPNAHVSAAPSTRVGGTVAFEMSVSVEPLGVGGSIPVKFIYDVNVDVTFNARNPIIVSPELETTEASVVPSFDIDIDGKAGAGAGIYIEVRRGQTFRVDLERISGSMTAGQ